MPATQPVQVNLNPEAKLEAIAESFRQLSRQLNYIFADIYWQLDQALGLEGSTLPAGSTTVGGFGEPTDLTIVGGKVTVTGVDTFRFHNIDTEAAAASDALTNVSGGNTGDLLMLQAKNSSRTVVLTNGTSLRMNNNFNLDSVRDKALYICISDGVWDHVSRRSNA